MEKTNEILSLLIVSIGFILIVYILAKYNYMVKKAMIDKGILVASRKHTVRHIDLGCILAGLGVGFLVSSIFTEMNLTEDTTDLLVWGTIGIFGGASLILAHFLRKKWGH
ncbi:hypothetical protein [Spongiimicrobium salis]|uniref:hypothetical protein n=1 Tax=Spongiimicrobium salis TaxID=1667022 RepID=UPI00374D6156